MNLPISQLPEITSGLTANAEFAISQGGTTYKVKTSNLSYGRPHISAYNVPSQSGFTPNTAYSVSASTISESYNISVVDGCKFTVSSGGTYNFQFSLQLDKLQGGSSENIDIWLSKNNVDVDWSNTRLTLANNNSLLVAAWNLVIDLNANDYLELKINVTSSEIILRSITSITSPNRPSIPSAIITVVQV